MISRSTLRGLSGLKGHPDAELEVLASAATERSFAWGEVLCREGELAKSCFLLVSGSLEVFRRNGPRERVFATVTPGAFIGQLALVDHGPRSASVRAASDSVVLELSRDTFSRLLTACSPMALRFQADIAVAGIRQLRQATERLTTVLQAQPTRAPAAEARRSRDDALEFIQTAATEWGLSLEDLDAIEAVRDPTAVHLRR